MLKKTFIFKPFLMLLLLFILSVSILSCETTENAGDNESDSDTVIKDDTTKDDTSEDNASKDDVPIGTEGLIFNSKTKLQLILLDFDYYSALAEDFVNNFKDNFMGRMAIRLNDSAEILDHEIVIGKSSREVSQEAYASLNKMMKDKGGEYGGYLLYSNGSSIALAYTEELENKHLYEIMDYLEGEIKKTSLVAKEGIVCSGVYNMHDIYAKEDEIRREEAFLYLAEKTSYAVAEVIREFYDELYIRDDSRDIISWLADLYQPRACICENYDENGIRICLHPVGEDGRDLCAGGGFYYSNGARDNEGYLPDIESTNQALEFLEKTGMLDKFGGQYQSIISGQLKADIIAFTKGLQNPDGYFYHPQWSLKDSQAHWARVSRDLMWSVSILSSFGAKPYYATPTGEFSGTGGRPKSASALTVRLSENHTVAVSRVVSLSSSLPEHLQSVDAFKEYLSSRCLNVWGNGYGVANDLAAQVGQLVEANKQIGGDEIKNVLFEWIEKDHREDNGLWTPTCYDALNAAFKIMMVYSAFQMPFRYAEAALESAIDVLSSDEDPVHVCGTYNAWYDISGLIRNIRTFDSAEKADELQKRVIEIAPKAIKQTITNTAKFLCEDGSFSYFADRTSVTSQGMPVSPAGKMGDVNASIICSGGIIEYIGMALGVKLPPIFGTLELAEFMDMMGN